MTGPARPRFVVYKELTGMWRWRLEDTDGMLTAVSENPYLTHGVALQDIDTVRDIGTDTPVVDLTTATGRTP